MTTIATNAAARARRGRYGLAQVTLMEWLKLRSLRSTWWTLAITFAGTISIGIAVGRGSRNASGT
jgi:ABC-2 type transport system permease protein